MLDKKQIEAAGRWLKLDAAADACCNKDRDRPDYDGSGCGFMVCEDCAPRVALSTTLAAYERVVALLQRWEVQVRLEVANPQTQRMAEDLRRAVEGE